MSQRREKWNFGIFPISNFPIAYLAILPSDLNLDTGVEEKLWGGEDRLFPAPDQLKVEIFRPKVDEADARLWFPMNVLVSGRSFGAILST